MNMYDINSKAIIALEKKKTLVNHYNECLEYDICPICGEALKNTTVYNPRVFFGLISDGYKNLKSCVSCDFVHCSNTMGIDMGPPI